MLAHATVGGLASEAQGGEFRHGFYASAASTGFMHSSVGKSMMGSAHIAVRTATAATIGGTASVLGGGKFANGAVTSAFQHLFNAEAVRYRPRVIGLLYSAGDPELAKSAQATADEIGAKYGKFGVSAKPIPVADWDEIENAGNSVDAASVNLHGVHRLGADGVDRWVGRSWLAGETEVSNSTLEKYFQNRGIPVRYNICGFNSNGMPYSPADETGTHQWRTQSLRLASGLAWDAFRESRK